MPQILTYVKPENKRVALSISIPDAKAKTARKIANQKGIAISRLIEEALDDYLKKTK